MTNTNQRRPSRFTITRGSSGCDETYNIVDVASGDVIAWLLFWEADAETKREAQLVVRALNAFRNRGGYLVMEAFFAAVHSESDIGALADSTPEAN